MKTLFTLLLSVLILTAYCQDKKPDSVKVDPPDTISVDLRTFDAYSRLIQVDMQRQSVQQRAETLKKESEMLDEKYNTILDAEVRHDPRFKGREIVGPPKIVGYNLVVLVKGHPCVKCIVLPPVKTSKNRNK